MGPWWHMADGSHVCTIVPVAESVADDGVQGLAAGATLLRSKSSLRPISREAGYKAAPRLKLPTRQLTPTPVVRSAGGFLLRQDLYRAPCDRLRNLQTGPIRCAAVTWTHSRAFCGPNTCQRRSDPGLYL